MCESYAVWFHRMTSVVCKVAYVSVVKVIDPLLVAATPRNWLIQWCKGGHDEGRKFRLLSYRPNLFAIHVIARKTIQTRIRLR
jgi:intein-encoded DNA endonuclease-like protein